MKTMMLRVPLWAAFIGAAAGIGTDVRGDERALTPFNISGHKCNAVFAHGRCVWRAGVPVTASIAGHRPVLADEYLLLLQNCNTNHVGADIAPNLLVVDIFDLLELLTSWVDCP